MAKSEYSRIIDAIKIGEIMDFIAIYEVRYGTVEGCVIRDIAPLKNPKYISDIGLYNLPYFKSISDSVKWALGPDYVQSMLKLHRENNSVSSCRWNRAFHKLRLWDRMFDKSLTKCQIGDTAIIAILSPHMIIAITNKRCQPSSEYARDIDAIKEACVNNNLILDVVDIDISDEETIAESAIRLEQAISQTIRG